MRLGEELDRRGYDFGPQEFEDAVLSVFDADYSDWTDEELICNTPHADKFVKAVRGRFRGLTIPHWLVNQTLLNLRKRSRTGHQPHGQQRAAVRLIDELERRGYAFGTQAFDDAIIGVFEERYPDWTDEELICNTPEAERFVRMIRGRLGDPTPKIPHWLINERLINLRKGSKVARRTGRRIRIAH